MTDTTAPRTAAPDLARLRELADAATPGPWRWWGHVGGHIALTTDGRGIVMVMGAKRLGMQGAEPTFYERSPEDRGKWGVGGVAKGASELAIREVPYRTDIVGIDHPDAAYIAALDPTTVLALLDRAEAIEPLLALVRASKAFLEAADAYVWNEHDLALLRAWKDVLDALDPAIVAAARKPE